MAERAVKMIPLNYDHSYIPVAKDEEEANNGKTGIPESVIIARIRIWQTGIAAFFLVCIAGTAAYFLRSTGQVSEWSTMGSSQAPNGIPLRREWRELSRPEQEHYISSVRCLLDVPSVIDNSSTRYADYPFMYVYTSRAIQAGLTSTTATLTSGSTLTTPRLSSPGTATSSTSTKPP